MIPYFICCIVGGIPLFYLEVCVGQFMGVAGLNAWKICPIFQGNFENLLKKKNSFNEPFGLCIYAIFYPPPCKFS